MDKQHTGELLRYAVVLLPLSDKGKQMRMGVLLFVKEDSLLAAGHAGPGQAIQCHPPCGGLPRGHYLAGGAAACPGPFVS